MLGSMGLFSVGMAFVCACGICSLLGVKYGPIHTSLPFLLMGLGVDDMFVMMACWRKIQFKEVDIPERIGLMLSHAGASITVTSVTDIAAFLIGSITVLPSLQSFCIYATVGIAMTYIFGLYPRSYGRERVFLTITKTYCPSRHLLCCGLHH